MTTRINVLPMVGPDGSLEGNIQKIEAKRTQEEGKVFEQAMSEMAGLTRIVQNEVEAQITQHTSRLLHALKFGLGASPRAAVARSRSIGFLSAGQPILASGHQLTTNVRVMASGEPFYTVASMVEGLERRRDASEDLIRQRLLELELKLLQGVNDLVSAKVGTWTKHILRTSM